MTLTPEDCSRMRSALGLTIERLASLAGLTERTVQRFEQREVAARPGTIIALAKGLRIAAGSTAKS